MEHSGVLSMGEKKYSMWLHGTETGDKRPPDEPRGSYADFTYLPKNLSHLPENMAQVHLKPRYELTIRLHFLLKQVPAKLELLCAQNVLKIC